MLSISEAEEAYYELSLKRFPSFSLSPGSDSTPFSLVSLTSSERTSAMFNKSTEWGKVYPSNQIDSQWFSANFYPWTEGSNGT